MTKSSVSDWDTTAANNTDVGGIDLGEGTMPISKVNDALRTIMAQLATYLGAITVDLGVSIHALTGKTTPVGADEVAISDSAASNGGKKVTLTNWWAQLGIFINAFTAKTTPIDADLIGVADSAASNAAKKVTFLQAWANYFKGKADALYQPLVTILTTFAALANASGVLTNNGSGGLSWVSSSSGGQTLLSTGTPTASASTYSVTGLATTYNQFLIMTEGVTSSAATMKVAVSSDNGSTYDTAITITSGAASPSDAATTIYGVGDTASKRVLSAANTILAGIFSVKTSPTNALQFSLSTGTFSGDGTIKIYGVK